MKLSTATFLCDAPQCRASTTIHEEPASTAVYLELVETGWKVQRPVSGGWKHYCPDHRSFPG